MLFNFNMKIEFFWIKEILMTMAETYLFAVYGCSAVGILGYIIFLLIEECSLKKREEQLSK